MQLEEKSSFSKRSLLALLIGIAALSAAVVLMKKNTSRMASSEEPQSVRAFGGRSVVEEFYRDYLEIEKYSAAQERPRLKFSRALNDLIAENERVCQEKAQSDVCGFGANGDIFLDSQELDPKLNFESAMFSIQEVPPDLVTVSFNVYPSMPDAAQFYQKEITYKLIEENGEWVVDDIFTYGSSARQEIKKEMALFQGL